MEYIAHKDGDREQTVKEHLTGTAKLASEFAGKFGKADWGYCCGMLHDVAPLVGAWIEMMWCQDPRVPTTSLPSWE